MVLKIKKKKVTFFSLIFLLTQNIFNPYYLLINAEEVKNLENHSIQSTDQNKNGDKDLLQISFDKDYYLIGPGDVLEITLFDAPEFSGIVKVLTHQVLA